MIWNWTWRRKAWTEALIRSEGDAGARYFSLYYVPFMVL